MEQKNESKKNEKNMKITNSKEKIDSNNNYYVKENPPITQTNKEQTDIKKISFELEKKNFQIIQQKGKINNNRPLDENKKSESINPISNKNNTININENINNKKLDKGDIKSYKIINKYDKKDKSELDNKNYYSLLNSYYKDVEINFKNEKTENKGKNFLHKNNFQEIPNKYNSNKIQNNIQYYPAYPQYMNYIYEISNNPNFYSYNNINNNQIPGYFFPENAFTINNEQEYFIANNNFNNYNYNFQSNKHKFNKKIKENIEPKFFLINLDNIIKGIDTRTTVMIRHIPNKYSYKILLEEIDTVCKDKYDFFYLPLDSENNCNLGYAFINFINPFHIIYFYNSFKSRKWLHFNSYKECDLTFAKYQGKYELTSNIEKNMGKNDDKRRKPMIFEIKNPPKIDLFKQYYEVIKKFKPELLNEINWI